jgi:hypothetical protein
MLRPTFYPKKSRIKGWPQVYWLSLSVLYGFLLSQGRKNVGRKQRMPSSWRGRELGVRLASKEPRMIGQFYGFDQTLVTAGTSADD